MLLPSRHNKVEISRIYVVKITAVVEVYHFEMIRNNLMHFELNGPGVIMGCYMVRDVIVSIWITAVEKLLHMMLKTASR